MCTLLWPKEVFGPNQLLLSEMPSQEEEERHARVPGVAVLFCLLGQEAGVEFLHLHHLLLGKRGAEGSLDGGRVFVRMENMEVGWIHSPTGFSAVAAKA